MGWTSSARRCSRDRRLRELVDYPSASDVFPGCRDQGGVCYFLWDATHEGDCEVTTIRGGRGRRADVQREPGRVRRLCPGCSEPCRSCTRSWTAVSRLSTRCSRGTRSSAWTSNFDGFHETERAGRRAALLHPNDEARCRLHRARGSRPRART